MQSWKLFVAFLVAVSGDNIVAQQLLPQDVKSFLERRQGCDHWRGESSVEKERLAEINKNTCSLCAGTDAQLLNLKRKYRSNAEVLASIKHIEARIELPSPREMAKACEKVNATLMPSAPSSRASVGEQVNHPG